MLRDAYFTVPLPFMSTRRQKHLQPQHLLLLQFNNLVSLAGLELVRDFDWATFPCAVLLASIPDKRHCWYVYSCLICSWWTCLTTM